MEITEIECKILRIKAGAILILGMQLGSELQLDNGRKTRGCSDATGGYAAACRKSRIFPRSCI
mgnify:CR=1 FL=1